MQSLLVSVRSDLAEKIISDEKPWEMRKASPKTRPNYLIVYSKKPIGAAIGYAKVTDILTFVWHQPYSIPKLLIEMKSGHLYNISLEEFLGRICISEKELRDYFAKDWLRECPRSIGGAIIQVADPIAIEPVKLPFHPPQQWRYFNGHPEEVISKWRNKC